MPDLCYLRKPRLWWGHFHNISYVCNAHECEVSYVTVLLEFQHKNHSNIVIKPLINWSVNQSFVNWYHTLIEQSPQFLAFRIHRVQSINDCMNFEDSRYQYIRYQKYITISINYETKFQIGNTFVIFIWRECYAAYNICPGTNSMATRGLFHTLKLTIEWKGKAQTSVMQL